MPSTTNLIAAGLTAACISAASGQTLTYDFPITVEQANPGSDVSGFDPSGAGLVMLNIATNELTWEVTYQDLTGPIVAPGAHFHGPAEMGQNAGVEIFLATGDPNGPTSGVLTGSAMLSAQQAADIQAGLWYVNIHTERNPSGEIRGQVVPAPASAAGLIGAGLLASRRRR